MRRIYLSRSDRIRHNNYGHAKHGDKETAYQKRSHTEWNRDQRKHQAGEDYEIAHEAGPIGSCWHVERQGSFHGLYEHSPFLSSSLPSIRTHQILRLMKHGNLYLI